MIWWFSKIWECFFLSLYLSLYRALQSFWPYTHTSSNIHEFSSIYLGLFENVENAGYPQSQDSNDSNGQQVRVKIQGMDQGPGPTHDPYPPIHTFDPYPMILHDPYPWSIPLIHTPDPYPFLVEERLMLDPMLLFILILLLVFVLLLPLLLPLLLLLPPLPALAASAASVLLLLPLLVIFLPGAAATAVASAAAPAGPAPAAGAGSLPPCASGSWTNATSWLATSNTASAPWRLVRPVLVPLGASCTSIVALWLQFLLFLLCLARVELDQTRNTPLSSFTAIAGQPAQIACPDPYPDPYPFHTRSIPEPSHATTNANMKVRFYYYFYCCCCFYSYSLLLLLLVLLQLLLLLPLDYYYYYDFY